MVYVRYLVVDVDSIFFVSLGIVERLFIMLEF